MNRMIIVCFKCQKTVDKIIQTEDFNTHSIIFQAFCHGQMEQVLLTKYDLVSANAITTGYAFRDVTLDHKEGEKWPMIDSTDYGS